MARNGASITFRSGEDVNKSWIVISSTFIIHVVNPILAGTDILDSSINKTAEA